MVNWHSAEHFLFLQKLSRIQCSSERIERQKMTVNVPHSDWPLAKAEIFNLFNSHEACQQYQYCKLWNKNTLICDAFEWPELQVRVILHLLIFLCGKFQSEFIIAKNKWVKPTQCLERKQEVKKKNEASKMKSSLFFSLICHHQP